jgi:hypothetical protein
MCYAAFVNSVHGRGQTAGHSAPLRSSADACSNDDEAGLIVSGLKQASADPT